MKVDMNKIKELRNKTGLGIMACKKALEATEGDVENAVQKLRKEGLIKAAKKSGRTAEEGIVHSYIHHNNKLGVLVEVNCETDFVAGNKEFENFVHEIALHIGAVEPEYVSPENVPDEVIEKEKDIYKEQMKKAGKPDNIIDKIVENKVEKYYEENCLLKQEFFGGQDGQTVEEYVKENIAKFGENIVVNRFALFKIGE
ncbi:MAG: translation elongation factor Ts [candidate division WOR-3 bacterium]|nr:translation elongation factor Ts [candidate division WOR-3 bacterium]